ncbi:hypothetical protein BDA99DRAFT_152216 [Phascolomyces articulosus]|uniref:Uncharacterized protein n=1 Tax=Phascolomyces articulosus TaxID=60185 RepID=A0AAD5PB56_9FUNG|nr:hypothetical protein BDA99DRAFT_152216 [Phascolomyces articulosus]
MLQLHYISFIPHYIKILYFKLPLIIIFYFFHYHIFPSLPQQHFLFPYIQTAKKKVNIAFLYCTFDLHSLSLSLSSIIPFIYSFFSFLSQHNICMLLSFVFPTPSIANVDIVSKTATTKFTQ